MQASSPSEAPGFIANPIDCLEDIFSQHQWSFERLSEDALLAIARSTVHEYRLRFQWQESGQALLFFCYLDFQLDEQHQARLLPLLASINDTLAVGYFSYDMENHLLAYRHTMLMDSKPAEDLRMNLERMLGIGLSTSERYYTSFDLIRTSTLPLQQLLGVASFDTVGNA